MTPAQFIANEVPTFQLGELIVVSGPDLAAIYLLLSDAQTALLGMSRNCPDPVDTRATIAYPNGIVASVPAPTTTSFKSANFVYCFSTPIWSVIRMTSGPNIGVESTVTAYDPVTQIFTVAPAFPVPPVAGNGFVIEPPNETSYKFEYLSVQNRVGGPTPGVILVGNQFDRGDPGQNKVPVDMDVDVVIDLLNVFNVKDVPESRSPVDVGVRELFSWINRIYYYDTNVIFIKTQVPGSPAPLINSVTPAFGAVAGNTIVGIDGSQFRPDTTVKFGNNYGTKVDVQSSVFLQCRTPAGIAGLCNVIVKNRDGQFDIQTSGFTYI